MRRVAAAVIERRGRILICQRRADGVFPRKWEFPGGKARPGEPIRAALARELREELGVRARIGKQIGRARHRYPEMPEPVEIIFLTADIGAAEPQNLCFKRIVWARRRELARYDFLAADRAMVSRLARGASTPAGQRRLAEGSKSSKGRVRKGSSGRHPRRAPAR